MSRIYMYLHTHWDREWYRSFEEYRMDLVDVVSGVLDGLESGSLPSFYLDGQSLAIEDAVELDPDLEGRIRTQMQAGRLTAGPWYVLADQMLVSGESLVRNLKLGLRSAARFGPPAMIGYCPDIFGHSQDLPRILAGFGIGTAVVWRGVPGLTDGPVFVWESPDGSSVRTYHLSQGYSQHDFLAGDADDKTVDYILPWVKRGSDPLRHPDTYCKQLDGALLPVGGDHTGPPHGFANRVESMNARIASESVELVPVKLVDFLDRIAALEDGLPRIAGELRDNASSKDHGNAFLLPGVLSSRLYLKRQNRQAEHRLVRVAEPLAMLMDIDGHMDYPADALDRCWKILIMNQPHDSICGCSVDPVHEEMEIRYKNVHQILDVLDRRHKEFLTGQDGQISPFDPDCNLESVTVFNLNTSKRGYPVRLDWTEHPGKRLKGNRKNLQVEKKERRDELFAGGGRPAYYKEADCYTGWVWPGSLPSFGKKTLAFPGMDDDAGMPGVVAGPGTLSNGLISIRVGEDGCLSVLRHSDKASWALGHFFRDQGDGGDTYNFDPICGDAPVVSEFRGVKPGLKGPLVGSLKLTSEISIPVSAVEDSSMNTSNGRLPGLKRTRRMFLHKVETEVILMRGLPLLFFESRWENRAKDHRLEVCFDTGGPVATTSSENHFSVVERRHGTARVHLPVDKGEEAVPDRFPCQRFFIANRQAFFNLGLPEYGVDGSLVSLTVLRAVSMLSRADLWSRGGGAGPHLPTPGANCLGENYVRYGWAPVDGDQDEAVCLAYELAGIFEGGLWACKSSEDAGAEQSFVDIDNRAIQITAFFRDLDSSICLRLLNVTENTQNAKIVLGFDVTDIAESALDGSPGLIIRENGPQAGPGEFTATFAPFQLRTFKLKA